MSWRVEWNDANCLEERETRAGDQREISEKWSQSGESE